MHDAETPSPDQLSDLPSDQPPRGTAVVLLAAGAGSRFRAADHKLLAELTPAGRTVFARALDNALASAVGPIVVVTGALTDDDFARDREVAELLDRPDVHTRHNPSWADGQSTSVRTGVTAAGELGAEAVVIGLADQPFVEPDAWRRVAAGLGPITVATYDGRRGNPVRLHASVWGLLPTSGDEGARVVMRERPDLVVGVPCPGSPADIDTVEDLQRWQNN